MNNENEITSFFADVFRSTHNKYVVDGIGDDAAELRISNNQVITTDILVEKQHFFRGTPAQFIAKRALVQNVADIEAMGAIPVAIVVSLGIPTSGDYYDDFTRDYSMNPFKYMQSFAISLAEASKDIGVAVIGGDLSSSETLTINICAVGELVNGRTIRRSGAKPGDKLACTILQNFQHNKTFTPLGLSAKGFQNLSKLDKKNMLQTMEDMKDISQQNNRISISQYLNPSIPHNQGVVANKLGATAMMDISDGLVVDALRIARASGVRIELYNSEEFCCKCDSKDDCISAELYYFGGEDHCLLATFPEEVKLPNEWIEIGKIYKADDDNASDDNLVFGDELDEIKSKTGFAVWDHFANKTRVYGDS